jgi:hypothetical protein
MRSDHAPKVDVLICNVKKEDLGIFFMFDFFFFFFFFFFFPHNYEKHLAKRKMIKNILKWHFSLTVP